MPWNIVEAQADTAMAGGVGAGTVRAQAVVYRELSRLYIHGHHMALVERLHYDLCRTVDAVLYHVRGMAHLPGSAVKWQHTHATDGMIGIGKRHPHRDFLGRFQVIIGQILVPGSKRWRVRLLDEERACQHHEVRSKQSLNLIKGT